MKKLWFMLAMMVCVLANCSDGGSEDPVNPTPKPEEVKTEITIDSGIITNGLSFGVEGSEQSVSFSVNANWTLSVASTTSGATWCKASATSGSKGAANVKFTVDENTGYDDRSVSVTIKAGSVSKTFTITQKGADALLVTTDKYEVAQEGGQIEIEVKANIDYQMEISEDAKGWITESSSRALTTYKHTLDIALNEDAEKREGEITFKSGDKVETVKVYQAGGALILLSQNEYTVSDAGETISVDIKSNVEYGVQMPDMDWITDKASSRGMSSHTLKYVIAPNEGYDSRSAEIIFYDKNSDLKDTLKVVQAQKDAIVVSEKNFSVNREGGIIEVKVNTNVDFEVQIPLDVTWVSQTTSRALTEKSIYLEVDENAGEEGRSVEVVFVNKESQISESITINQAGVVKAGYENGVVTIATAGTMKKLLGDDYLNVTSLKVVGPINGDDVYYLRKMLGGNNFSEADWGKLTTLDLTESTIVEGGDFYYDSSRFPGGECYTSNNLVSEFMFAGCTNLQVIMLPNNILSLADCAFAECPSLKSINIPNTAYHIGEQTFQNCSSLSGIIIPDCVNTIGKDAFLGCSALKSVTMSKNITSIAERTFGYCSSLESITIPDNVTMIGDYAFQDCFNLTSIIIPEKVKTLGDYSFFRCLSLNSVKLGNSLNSIGEAVFFQCRALISITIPESVTSIGRMAFWQCEKIKSIKFSKNVTTIGESAFNGVKINECYCYATTPPVIPKNGSVFLQNLDATLYVPARCGTKYKTSYWGSYFKKIKEIDE